MVYEADQLLQLAEQAVSEHDFPSAISHYEALLKKHPTHLAAINNLSLLYVKNNYFDKAKHLLKKAILLDKDNASLHNNLGLIYYKCRQFSEAEKSFLHALSIKKDYLSAMYNLALAYQNQNKKPGAVACLLALIDADENFFQAYFLLGKILLDEKNTEKASAYFASLAKKTNNSLDIVKTIFSILLEYKEYKTAKSYCFELINQEPHNPSFLYNAGVIAEKENLPDAALEFYEKALLIDPHYFPALNNAAILYLAKQSPEKAKDYFEKALKQQPENEAIQYTLSALRGEQTQAFAPTGYISQLFDAYADHFDQHLTEGLDYRVPDLLYSACKPYLPEHFISALDLGCGTGLTGQAFLKHQKKMVGVDLSQNMLHVAMTKKIYSTLYCQEIVDFLSTNKETFDVILAGDVFVYTGKLVDIFSLVGNTLHESGLFAFSIELSPRENFLLRPSGRFAHSKNYIQALAQEYNFDVLVEHESATRSQFNQPLSGVIYVLKKLR